MLKAAKDPNNWLPVNDSTDTKVSTSTKVETETKTSLPAKATNPDYQTKLVALNKQIDDFLVKNKPANPYPIHRQIIRVDWAKTDDISSIVTKVIAKGFRIHHLQDKCFLVID